MFEIDKHHFIPCDETTGTFPSEKPRYTMTEEVEHTAREMRNTIERLLRFEKRVESKFEDLMKHLTSDNVIFKNTFAQAYNTFLMEVKNEVNSFEGNVDSSMRLFKHDLESNYATLSEECREQIAEYYRSITDDYATLSEECREQITEYYNQFVSSLNTYKTELNTAYDAFRDAIENRLTQYNTSYTESFNGYTSQTNAKLSALEKSFNADYSEFVTQVNRTVTSFMNEWNNNIDARLDSQDAIINDAKLYLSTNLVETIETKLLEMKLSGELEEIIERDVFDSLAAQTSILPVNIKKYGAIGDGMTDETVAFASAFEDCSRVYVPKGVYQINSAFTIPENCELIMEGNINSLNGKSITDFDGTKYAVMRMGETGKISMHNGSKLNGGLIYAKGETKPVIELDIGRENMQNVEISTAILGFFAPNSTAVLFNGSTGSSGSLCHSKFTSAIRGFHYAYYLNRATGNLPWVTFCEFAGVLAQNRKAFSHNLTNMSLAFGTSKWDFTLCGGVWNSENEAIMDCVGDHGTYNISLSDIGEDHTQKIAMDFAKASYSIVNGIPYDSPLIINQQGKYLYFTNGAVNSIAGEHGTLHYAINGGLLTATYVGKIPTGGFVWDNLPFSNLATFNVPYMDKYGVRVRTEKGWNKLTFINDTGTEVSDITLQFTSFIM